MSISQRENLAGKLVQKKNWAKVIETLEPYNHQISEDGLLYLALAYGQTKEFAKEIKILSEIESNESKKKSHEIYYIIGRARMRYASNLKSEESVVEEQKAVQSLRKAISAKPDYKPAYDALLQHFDEKKLFFESQGLLTDMKKKFGPRPEILNDLCRVYVLQKYFDEAKSTCTLAIKTSPDFPPNFIYYAKALINKGADDRASETLIKAAERFPASKQTQADTGLYYLGKKNYPVAIRYLKQAVKIDPESAQIQAELGRAYFGDEKYDLALTHFMKACSLDGKHQEPFREALTYLRNNEIHQFSSKYSAGISRCKDSTQAQK